MKIIYNEINKRLKTSVAFLSLVLLLSSCDGFLEVTPVGQTTTPLFFSDMNGIRAALPGAYSKVFDYYNTEFYIYPEVAGNMVDLSAVAEDGDMMDEYNFVSSPDDEGLTVGHIWAKIFKAMANVNNILQYLPALEGKYPGCEAELTQIKAQALFMRALCHFDLCRVYAQPYNYTSDASHPGIPVLLRTPGAYDYIGRSSVNDVYAQIVTDLNNSIEAFGNTAKKDAYHASRLSSQALLSRVYLYMENWDMAIQYADAVLKEVPLAYGDNYLSMYNNMEAGKEAIFRLNGLNNGTTLGTFYSPTGPKAFAADTLISLFPDTMDIRWKLFKKTGSLYYTLKYYVKDVSLSNKHYDPIVFRASELYLIRAEAYLNKNMPDKAAENLKHIIARAYGVDDSSITLPADKAALTLLLEKERAKELCFEGHQFFDITRRKQNLVRGASTNSTVTFMAYPNDRFVLPIPQKELDVNANMVGNPTVNN